MDIRSYKEKTVMDLKEEIEFLRKTKNGLLDLFLIKELPWIKEAVQHIQRTINANENLILNLIFYHEEDLVK